LTFFFHNCQTKQIEQFWSRLNLSKILVLKNVVFVVAEVEEYNSEMKYQSTKSTAESKKKK
jgi:hypothetical protein